MNRKELLARIGRQLNKADVLDPRTQARLLDYINSRHRQILSGPGMGGLRRRQERFVSAAGVARYAFYNGEKFNHLRDVTNDFELSQRSLSTYRRYNPDPSQTQGTPDAYIQYGFEPVARQPVDVVSDVSTSSLYVVSNSAADTTQTVYLESITGSGSATMNGTTPVYMGGGVPYIDKFYLSAPCVGFVSLYINDPTKGITGLFAGQVHTRWLTLYFDPTPSAVLSYDADAEFSITDLAQDNDEPQLPSDFHDLLEIGVVMDECFHLDDSRLAVYQQQYQRRLGELKLRLARQGTDAGPRGGHSRLGPWAPAGRW